MPKATSTHTSQLCKTILDDRHAPAKLHDAAAQLDKKVRATDQALRQAGHDPKRQAQLKKALHRDLASIERDLLAEAEPYLAKQQQSGPQAARFKELLAWVHQQNDPLGQHAMSAAGQADLKQLTDPGHKWTGTDFVGAAKLGAADPAVAKQLHGLLGRNNPLWAKQYDAAVACTKDGNQGGLAANIPVAFALDQLKAKPDPSNALIADLILGKNKSASPGDLDKIRGRLSELHNEDAATAAALVHALPPAARGSVGPLVGSSKSPPPTAAPNPSPAPGAALPPAGPPKAPPAGPPKGSPAATQRGTPSSPGASPAADLTKNSTGAAGPSLKRLTTPNYKWTGSDFVTAAKLGAADPQVKAQLKTFVEKADPAWGPRYLAATTHLGSADQAQLAADIPVPLALTSLGNPTAKDNLQAVALLSGKTRAPTQSDWGATLARLVTLQGQDPLSAKALAASLPAEARQKVAAELAAPGYTVRTDAQGQTTYRDLSGNPKGAADCLAHYEARAAQLFPAAKAGTAAGQSSGRLTPSPAPGAAKVPATADGTLSPAAKQELTRLRAPGYTWTGDDFAAAARIGAVSAADKRALAAQIGKVNPGWVPSYAAAVAAAKSKNDGGLAASIPQEMLISGLGDPKADGTRQYIAAVTGKQKSLSFSDRAAVGQLLASVQQKSPVVGAALVHQLPVAERGRLGELAKAGFSATQGSDGTVAYKDDQGKAISLQQYQNRFGQHNVDALTTAGHQWTGGDFVAAVKIGASNPTSAPAYRAQLVRANAAYGPQFDAAIAAYKRQDMAGVVAKIPAPFAYTALGDPKAGGNAATIAILDGSNKKPSVEAWGTAMASLATLQQVDPASTGALLAQLPENLRGAVGKVVLHPGTSVTTDPTGKASFKDAAGKAITAEAYQAYYNHAAALAFPDAKPDGSTSTTSAASDAAVDPRGPPPTAGLNPTDAATAKRLAAGGPNTWSATDWNVAVRLGAAEPNTTGAYFHARLQKGPDCQYSDAQDMYLAALSASTPGPTFNKGALNGFIPRNLLLLKSMDHKDAWSMQAQAILSNSNPNPSKKDLGALGAYMYNLSQSNRPVYLQMAHLLPESIRTSVDKTVSSAAGKGLSGTALYGYFEDPPKDVAWPITWTGSSAGSSPFNPNPDPASWPQYQVGGEVKNIQSGKGSSTQRRFGGHDAPLSPPVIKPGDNMRDIIDHLTSDQQQFLAKGIYAAGNKKQVPCNPKDVAAWSLMIAYQTANNPFISDPKHHDLSNGLPGGRALEGKPPGYLRDAQIAFAAQNMKAPDIGMEIGMSFLQALAIMPGVGEAAAAVAGTAFRVVGGVVQAAGKVAATVTPRVVTSALSTGASSVAAAASSASESLIGATAKGVTATRSAVANVTGKGAGNVEQTAEQVAATAARSARRSNIVESTLQGADAMTLSMPLIPGLAVNAATMATRAAIGFGSRVSAKIAAQGGDQAAALASGRTASATTGSRAASVADESTLASTATNTSTGAHAASDETAAARQGGGGATANTGSTTATGGQEAAAAQKRRDDGAANAAAQNQAAERAVQNQTANASRGSVQAQTANVANAAKGSTHNQTANVATQKQTANGSVQDQTANASRRSVQAQTANAANAAKGSTHNQTANAATQNQETNGPVHDQAANASRKSVQAQAANAANASRVARKSQAGQGIRQAQENTSAAREAQWRARVEEAAQKNGVTAADVHDVAAGRFGGHPAAALSEREANQAVLEYSDAGERLHAQFGVLSKEVAAEGKHPSTAILNALADTHAQLGRINSAGDALQTRLEALRGRSGNQTGLNDSLDLLKTHRENDAALQGQAAAMLQGHGRTISQQQAGQGAKQAQANTPAVREAQWRARVEEAAQKNGVTAADVHDVAAGRFGGHPVAALSEREANQAVLEYSDVGERLHAQLGVLSKEVAAEGKHPSTAILNALADTHAQLGRINSAGDALQTRLEALRGRSGNPTGLNDSLDMLKTNRENDAGLHLQAASILQSHGRKISQQQTAQLKGFESLNRGGQVRAEFARWSTAGNENRALGVLTDIKPGSFTALDSTHLVEEISKSPYARSGLARLVQGRDPSLAENALQAQKRKFPDDFSYTPGNLARLDPGHGNAANFAKVATGMQNGARAEPTVDRFLSSLNGLKTKLHGTPEGAEFNQAFTDLRQLSDFSPLRHDAVSKAYPKKDLESLISRLKNRSIQNTTLDVSTGNHSLIVQVHRTGGDHASVSIFNTGAGLTKAQLANKPAQRVGGQKVYNSFTVKDVDLKALTVNDLQRLTSKARTETSSSPSANQEAINGLYDDVSSLPGATRDLTPRHLQAPQKNGDCSIKTILAFLKSTLSDGAYRKVRADVFQGSYNDISKLDNSIASSELKQRSKARADLMNYRALAPNERHTPEAVLAASKPFVDGLRQERRQVDALRADGKEGEAQHIEADLLDGTYAYGLQQIAQDWASSAEKLSAPELVKFYRGLDDAEAGLIFGSAGKPNSNLKIAAEVTYPSTAGIDYVPYRPAKRGGDPAGAIMQRGHVGTAAQEADAGAKEAFKAVAHKVGDTVTGAGHAASDAIKGAAANAGVADALHATAAGSAVIAGGHAVASGLKATGHAVGHVVSEAGHGISAAANIARHHRGALSRAGSVSKASLTENRFITPGSQALTRAAFAHHNEHYAHRLTVDAVALEKAATDIGYLNPERGQILKMNVNESLSYPARDAKDNLIRDASGNPTMVPAHKVDDYAREYRHDGEIHTFGGLSAQRWVPTDPASKARTLIIFRGTAPALGPTQGSGVLADLEHAGVGHGIFSEKKKELLEWVNEAKGNVTITGHSLGGALATRLYAESGVYQKTAKLVTFSAPGVDRQTADKIDNAAAKSQVTRYYVKHDPVVRAGSTHPAGTVIRSELPEDFRGFWRRFTGAAQPHVTARMADQFLATGTVDVRRRPKNEGGGRVQPKQLAVEPLRQVGATLALVWAASRPITHILGRRISPEESAYFQSANRLVLAHGGAEVQAAADKLAAAAGKDKKTLKRLEKELKKADTKLLEKSPYVAAWKKQHGSLISRFHRMMPSEERNHLSQLDADLTRQQDVIGTTKMELNDAKKEVFQQGGAEARDKVKMLSVRLQNEQECLDAVVLAQSWLGSSSRASV